MALTDFGEVPASSVLPIFFTSHDAATGANEALSNIAVGDILCYKDTSMTQRSSTSGLVLLDTDGIDLDSLTGVNGVSIDLSDNTDAGFWAVGSFYNIVLGPVTIDTQTVYIHLATFRIKAAEAIAGKPKVDVDGWLGTAAATPTVAGVPEVDLTHVAGSTTSVSTLASSVATLIADIGGVATAAADGDPTNTDLLFSYVKQILNVLMGSAGIVAWPASAAPGNAVSIAEALRYLYDQVGVAGAGLTAADDAVIAAIPSAAVVADAVWDEDATAHQTQGTFGQAIGDPVADAGTIYKATVTDATGVTVGTDTATMLTRLGTPSDLGGGATVAGNLSDIEAQTDDIGAAGAGLTSLATAAELAKVPKSDGTASWNATALAALQSEANDALVAYDPPTHAELTSGLAAADDAVLAQVALVKAQTDLLPSDPADASVIAGRFDTLDTSIDALPTNAELATALGTADDAVLAAIATLQAFVDTEVAAILVDTNNLNDVALADSVPADGALPTMQQAIYEIRQFLMERSVVGTTVTTKKVNGSTTLETFTLDDDTAPTSITRAT